MPEQSLPVVIVIDAYSSGAHLPSLFARAGWRVIHLQSAPEIPAHYLRGYPGDEAFHACHLHAGDMDETTRRLARYHPAALVCGAETGAVLQDRLARALGLPGNDPATTAQRTDKFAMHAALAHAGVAHARQILAQAPEKAIGFAEENAGWPIVLKPLDSAGGDGVTFCCDAGAVRRAMAALLGRSNALGRRNMRLAVQECLHGDEYVVNAVARGGHRVVCEIWRIHKSITDEGHSIYDFGELLDGAGPVQDGLSSYLHAVAAALGIDEGAIHAEIMLTRRGPVLIEIAVRPAGAISHATTSRALGDSHASLLVRSLTQPADFQARAESGYRRRCAAAFVSLIHDRNGVVREVPGRAYLGTLPSFVEAIGLAGEGARIARTENLFSGGGLVYLCHESETQIRDDIAALRAYEREGFYLIETHAPDASG